MVADVPTVGAQHLFAEGTGRLFQLGGHGVVPPVQVSEQRQNRHDGCDLVLVEVFGEFGKVLIGCRIRYLACVKSQTKCGPFGIIEMLTGLEVPDVGQLLFAYTQTFGAVAGVGLAVTTASAGTGDCLLYTSPSPRDQRGSRMPSSA